MKAQNIQIQRSLDRLKQFSNHTDPKLSISAFFHIAKSLLEYASNHKQNPVNDQYFKQFYVQYQKFSKQDFSSLKSNHQKILDQIAEIVQSKGFVIHLRSDKKKLTKIRNSLQIRKSQIIQLTPEVYSYGDIAQQQFQRKIMRVSSNQQDQKSESNISTQQNQNSCQQEQLFCQIKKLYQEHIIDQAFKKVTQYLQMIPNLKTISKQKTKLIQTINMEYQTVNSLHKQFTNPGWIHDKQEDGITLQYKIYENETMALKLQGQGQFPIAPFLAIISQIDLMGEYVPFCYGCKQIKDISRNQKIGTSKIYLPILNDRETYFYAAGYDRMKQNKSLFFFTKTITSDQTYQRKFNFKVPQQGDFVRLQYEFFIIQYQPKDEKRAKIKLASKVDMKLNFMPQFILFKTSRIFAMDYFKNILQKIKNFKGSPWEKKVQQNPHKYKFFDRKINEYLLK